jgi:cation transport regulator
VPYKQITQLPDGVKNNLPKGAQEIYKEAFNSAEDQYGEEDRAHRVAWSAVEQKYEKNEKATGFRRATDPQDGDRRPGSPRTGLALWLL